MSIGLHRLLEGTHLLNFEHLATPLIFNGYSLLALKAQLLTQATLLLLELFNFGL